jgi:photosystem II stability/assembly factor-like uncharacterized protein
MIQIKFFYYSPVDFKILILFKTKGGKMKFSKIFTNGLISFKTFSIVLGIIFINSTNSFSQGWKTIPLPINSVKNAVFFVNANTGFMVGGFPFMFKSTNGGENWTNLNLSLGGSGTLNDVYFVNENTGYAVGYTSEGIVIKTTNGGDNWNLITPGTTKRNLTCVHFFNADNGIIGSSANAGPGQNDTAFFITSNGGNNWTKVTIDTTTSIYAMSFPSQSLGFSVGGHFTVGQNYHNFYSSSNSGLNWTYNSPDAAGILNSVYFTSTSTGYAVGRGNFSIAIKSTDAGVNWTAMTTNSQTLEYRDVFFTSELTGYIVGSSTGSVNIQATTDGGNNWFTQFGSSTTLNVQSIFFMDENTGWVCGTGPNILKTTDGGGTVSISTVSSEIPEDYSLEQNYPNPFNPTTKIDFNISKKGFVSLKVYNSQGKEVADLVKTDLTPGSYSYEFNAISLPSGMYFYRLQTNNFMETKKMLLLK